MFRSKAEVLLVEKCAQEGRRIEQKEVAKATNLTESTISHWFSDRPMLQVRARVVSALCKYFDCRIDDLLAIVGDEESPESQSPLLIAVGS